MARFRSRDGLMESSDPKAVEVWDGIVARQESEKQSWTEILRARGVKYAHPDDGWVHRENGTHTVSWYPQFDDRPEVGDLIAFGCPPSRRYNDPEGKWYHSNHDHPDAPKKPDSQEAASSGYRICRVTAVNRRHGPIGFMQDFTYEDTGERMPARKPTRWQQIKARLARAASNAFQAKGPRP